MKILEDLSELINDLAEHDCMFMADSETGGSCYNQFLTGALDLDCCCLACRAMELESRETL